MDNQPVWTAVDYYFNTLLVASDPALDAALRDSAQAGMLPHNVAPNQAKLLQLLVLIRGAKRVLEIGTLGGYSTIWLARSVPDDGQVISLEVDPERAAVARANVERSGVSGRVDIRAGWAVDTLAQLAAEGPEPFDFIFIDADKPSNPAYLAWALKLSRRGTVIVADNVVRNGAVTDPETTDANVQGVQRFSELVAQEPRLSATVLQTVGEKGYDGFMLALVVAD